MAICEFFRIFWAVGNFWHFTKENQICQSCRYRIFFTPPPITSTHIVNWHPPPPPWAADVFYGRPQTSFIQFLWFFRLKCWLQGQIISRIHLSLLNAYTLMCFDRNINENRNVEFFDLDYWSMHWKKKITLSFSSFAPYNVSS